MRLTKRVKKGWLATVLDYPQDRLAHLPGKRNQGALYQSFRKGMKFRVRAYDWEPERQRSIVELAPMQQPSRKSPLG